MYPIVIVAPLKKIANVAHEVCKDLNLDIPIIIANDEMAPAAALKYKDASVFISRGGTADALTVYTNKTIVNLIANFDDIAIAIEKLIEHKCKNIAVVTSHNIIGYSNKNYNLGAVNVSFYSCESIGEIEERINYLYENKLVDGIAGCIHAVKFASSLNLPNSLILASYSCIKQAIYEALEIYRNSVNYSTMIEHLNILLDNTEAGAIIFNDKYEAIFFNDQARNILADIDISEWKDIFYKYLVDSKANKNLVNAIKINNKTVLAKIKNIDKADLSSNYLVIMQDGVQIDKQHTQLRHALYSQGLYAKTTFKDILYQSNCMHDAVELAKKFAKSDSTILIYGETGVGKEGFAQSIHNASLRKKMPFVSVNCATLSKELASSELFGYVEGAFTGARKSGKQGLFELAQGGTIFLDEITEIPLEVQSQLLRVLQERELRRLGDDKVIPLDIRVICATNMEIEKLCNEGKFRFDLYYRIYVLTLRIPPLRKRQDDILLLFLHFVALNLSCHINDLVYDDQIIDLIRNYPFLGNVRELKNLAEYVSFYGRNIKYQVVYERLYPNGQDINIENNKFNITLNNEASLQDVEDAYLTLLFSKYTLNEVEKISGLSRTSLWRKQKKLMEKNFSK